MHRTPTQPTRDDRPRGASAPGDAAARPERKTPAARGQVLVLFVMAIFVITGLVGIVIDISWYWSNSLRIQRAADAAALAGAVDLPSRPGVLVPSSGLGTAVGDAIAQAAKNGYSGLTPGCRADKRTPSANPGICIYNDPANPNELAVSISSPVQTYFARVFGIQTWNSTRYSKAQFALPIPMGSPENYYGVFGNVRNATMTSMRLDPPGSWRVSTGARASTLPLVAGAAPTGTWTATPITNPVTSVNAALAINESSGQIFYAQSGTNGAVQQLGTFGLLGGGGIPAPTAMPTPTAAGDTSTAISIVGLQVMLNGARVDATCSNSTIAVAVSYNGGTSWTTSSNVTTNPSRLTTTARNYTFGASNSLSAWTFSSGHTWVRDDFSDANFRIRLTANKGCGGAPNLQLNQLQVIVSYTVTTTTATESPQTTTATYALTGPGTPCANGVANCFTATPAGGGQALNPRGFWGTMNTAGAANINGDAYQPYYDNPTGSPAKTCPSSGNACYDPTNYYNYAIEMPPNTTGGYVYVFDPVFCDTALSSGTGDRWFGGSNPVSSWYELFKDVNNTPYNYSDDTLVATSGTTFRDIAASDTTMGGSGGSECRQQTTAYGDGRDYHNSWYLLNPGSPLTGGPSGTTYRLHTTSSVPLGQSDPVNQLNTNGEQSFAIFANDTEGTTSNGLLPKVYGLGAMQMFTPLSASGGTTNSEFYLAQVPAYYAGKILEINLWDPGDTSPLAATLYIEVPTGSGWTPTPFTYKAQVGTTNGGANGACNSNSNSSSSNNRVQTSTGASLGLFNGCWLTLDIPIPTNYTAAQNGWWKILYSMSGNGTSSDVTTWTASIKGNPVHLIVP